MNISIIAAVGMNNELGKAGKLLWSLPLDMKHFRETTSGHTVIMGRKTFESIGRPLPNRKNIVITRNTNYSNLSHGVDVVQSLEKALKISRTTLDTDEVFVIGGAEIYKEALPMANVLYLTKVEGEFEADTYFPTFDESKWQKVKEERHEKDEHHPYAFNFIEYRKLTK